VNRAAARAIGTSRRCLGVATGLRRMPQLVIFAERSQGYTKK
jgi:hypothetical protein